MHLGDRTRNNWGLSLSKVQILPAWHAYVVYFVEVLE